MSNRAKVTVFYGVCYAPESEAAHKIRGGDCEVKGSPTWMYANLYRQAHDGVQVVRFGHYDLLGLAFAVEGTVQDAWGPLPLGPDVIDLNPDAAALRAYCEKHGLPWSEPQWWAVPYYG